MATVGKTTIEYAGQPIDFADCGANRVVELVGVATNWDQMEELATDAGHLLDNVQPPIQGHFPSETLRLAEAPLRWICALFDLAWAKIPESPLRTEIDKSVWVEIDPDVVDPNTLPGDMPADMFPATDAATDGPHASAAANASAEEALEGFDVESEGIEDLPNGQRIQHRPKSRPWRRRIPLAEWPRFVREFPCLAALRFVSEPPEWYSTLADVTAASVYAIDIFLADIALKDTSEQDAAEEPRGNALNDPGVSLFDAAHLGATCSDPITLSQAAELLLVEVATIRKRGKGNRPEPEFPSLGRNPARFSYAKLRPWLANEFSHRANQLPESYKEAMRKLTDASSEVSKENT